MKGQGWRNSNTLKKSLQSKKQILGTAKPGLGKQKNFKLENISNGTSGFKKSKPK